MESREKLSNFRDYLAVVEEASARWILYLLILCYCSYVYRSATVHITSGFVTMQSDQISHIYLMHAYSFLWQEGGGERMFVNSLLLKQWKWEKWSKQRFQVEIFVDKDFSTFGWINKCVYTIVMQMTCGIITVNLWSNQIFWNWYMRMEL